MIKTAKTADLKPNLSNPRLIDNTKYSQLLKSLQEFPEMIDARPIVVNSDMEVLGGNMRLKAMLELGIKTAKIKIVDWPIEKQREFIIKDNLNYGTWDWQILASDFGKDLLDEYGLDMPKLDFNPVLEPSFNDSIVKPGDIEKAAEDLEIKAKIADTIEVICPHCAHEFSIKN